MKTQISRDSRQPRMRYSGVYQQQGRMLTDADWNELVDILKSRVDTALADVVGSGAPKRLKSDGSVQRTPVVAKDQLLPGDLFADGLTAELRSSLPDQTAQFSYLQQADFPNAPALPANNYFLYADIWERPLTALEDDAIRDPGLYGADTCTRTQTMAQVKWCPGTGDPGNAAKNPPCGNATAKVVLRAGSILADPCDPCASEVSLKSGVGDYLFRMEVHDVAGDADAPTTVTLKWSTENGAEAYGTAAPLNLPPDFSGSQWVYEIFDGVSERHLGVHLATTGSPVRGTLVNAVPATFDGGDCIRRWDGYATLNRSGATWTLAAGGYDGNVVLSTTNDADADGHVAITADGISLNLRTVVLSLTVAGKQFVAGDYWLVPVRTNQYLHGDTVPNSATPNGIVHHYLKLAKVDNNGNILSLSTTENQHLSFPKLTELDAKDVGYHSTADNDFFSTSDDTVQRALDKLAALPAKYIPYTPTHPRSSYPHHVFDTGDNTVQKALDEVCGIQAETVGFTKPTPTDNSIYQAATVATVDDALKLFSNLWAAHVKYDPSRCAILAGAVTVQQALDNLCAYLEKVILDNTARLALFGRGVLYGLIPTVTVQSTNLANKVTVVKFDVTPGVFIDGKGGLWRVTLPPSPPTHIPPALSLTVEVTAYRTQFVFDAQGITNAVGALQVFAGEPRKFKQASGQTVTLQPGIMGPIIDTLSVQLKSAIPENLVFASKAKAAEWAAQQDTRIVISEFKDKLGEILTNNMKAVTVPQEVQVSLYVNVVSGSPALQVQFNSPPPVADNIPGRQIPVPGDIDGLLDPTGAVIPGSTLDCSHAQQAVWGPYAAAVCPQPNDGSVCLGVAGVSGGSAFICPDFREQIIYTPAQAVALRAGELWIQKVTNKLTYQDLAAKCFK